MRGAYGLAQRPVAPYQAIATYLLFFHREPLRSHGRAADLLLTVICKLKSEKYLQDFTLGLRLISRGRLNFLNIPRGAARYRRQREGSAAGGQTAGIATPTIRAAVQDHGCEYDASFRNTCGQLGIAVEEMQDWFCCGAGMLGNLSPLLGLATPLKNLALAHERGFAEVVAPCSACYSQFKRAGHELQEHPECGPARSKHRISIGQLRGKCFIRWRCWNGSWRGGH